MSLRIQASNVEFSEPLKEMEYDAELKKSSRHQNMSRAAANEEIPLQHESNSVKLQDKLKTEKFTKQSNKDLHYRAERKIVHYKVRQDDAHRLLIPPKSLQNHRKQRSNSEVTQNDELVKYMSNLPCYLQRMEIGRNLQEKALNFGVLDWEHLEKWKYKKKQIPNRGTTYDPSTSNASSSFTTVGSSTLYGRSHNGSSACQKKQSHSSFPNLNSTLNDEINQRVKPTRGKVSDLQETRVAPHNNSFIGTQELLAVDQFFCQNYSEIKLEKQSKRKDLNPKIIPEKETSSSRLKDHGISFCPRGKMQIQDGKSERRSELLHQLTYSLPDNPCPGRHKNIILILPRDCSRSNSLGIYKQVEFPMSVDGRSAEADQKSFSDSLHHKEEVCLADLYSDVPHSCPLPCTVEDSQESDTKLPYSLYTQGTEVPSEDASGLVVTPEEVPTGQDNDVEEIKPSSLITVESSCRLDPNAAEVRNQLPNHRPSSDLGRLSRSYFKGVETIPQLRSSYVTVKSGPARSDVPALSDDSARDKTNTNSRGRSSPLRRLLEPLLKPKAANCPELLLKESKSNHRACKSFDGQRDSSTVQSVKRNLNLSNSGPVNADDSCAIEKHVESMMHALMQVKVKNGLPMFTFVVDSATDVLAATMRKESTTVKDGYSWVYTICTVREIKKKSGRWVSQGSKGKNHGYASSVVGQMKVSQSQCPMQNRHNFNDHFLVRKFVLFGVELRQADQETLDFHPNSELASIIIKLPEENSGHFRDDGWQSNKNIDLSDMRLSSSISEERCLCNAGENPDTEHNAVTERVTSTVVIVPSGVHSLPSTGVPSSLVDRWKSGGSCDCGGWDMGCKLRILTNQGQWNENFTSSKASSTPEQFDLFIQGGCQQNRPVFSLTPFKKGIFSVDFHGSLTFLQAFSICIAVVNIRKPYQSELSNMFEAKGPHETLSIENERIHARPGAEHARYAPFPPLSPVGRV
ncbi:uncharacterized protein LOC122094359 [Macadamia integrifolia]|uniref:uncharacterized protein LOC122094359 n=1 Tax=Macadamia integrifolia TaxID=60698 RepID=UPI001C52F55E|nr:uncharacterized protein LOC122094359 [Macadamia integrifolia]XP_042521065.1 uncharacterized protein LOC122094359 [Macadamia integrifolia]